MALRLRQGQVWKSEDEFIRIVHLERLEVKYKTLRDLKSGEGEHHTATKKEFCRLLKNCTLIPAKGNPDTASTLPTSDSLPQTDLAPEPSEESKK